MIILTYNFLWVIEQIELQQSFVLPTKYYNNYPK